MNRIEKVSIGGVPFTLEADAFSVLNQYLVEQELCYLQKSGGREKMDEIEERLARLLSEQLVSGDIVTRKMVENAMVALGRHDLLSEKPRTKLFRDTDHRVFGGVCSGLAARFGIDPVLLRIVWVAVFVFGSWSWVRGSITGIQTFSALLYIVLWICMPAATSAQLHYELRKVNVKPASDFWRVFGDIMRVFMGFILIIVGASGFLAGIILLLGSTMFGLGAMLMDWKEVLIDTVPMLAPVARIVWVNVLAALVVFLPFAGMLYGGVMMTFNLKTPRWHPGLIMASVWLVLVIALAAVVLSSVLPFGI